MFNYVYVLKSENDGNNYVGYTNDLRARMNLHNAGKVLTTKNRLPIKLIYFEGCLNQQDATKLEKYLKTAWVNDISVTSMMPLKSKAELHETKSPPKKIKPLF